MLSFSCAGKSVSRQGVNKMAVTPLIGTYQVNRYVLENGLRVLIIEDHSSPTLAYNTWFRVGSRNEILGRTGLAHLFEHMMFKGTKDHPEGDFDKLLEAAGEEGENAFTSRDYTAYVQELPSDKLDLIAKLESDRMVNLVVDEKSFRTELEVVQNERRFRNENNPDGTMYQELFGLAFTKHPYHWPVVGYQEDLEKMSATDAREFYHSYYSPNHATVIIVGDVEPERALGIVKKHYGDIPAQPAQTHDVEAEPLQTSAKHKILKLNIQVEKLLLGYKIPEIASGEIPALNLLQTILTGGKSSRLYRALVSTGIASGIDAYDLEDKDPSLLIFTSNLQKGKKATQAEAIIQRELQRIAREAVSEQELERAKNRLNFGFYEGLASNEDKAHFLGHYEAVGDDFALGIKIQKKIQTVSAADIQAVAKHYLDSKNRSVITGVRK